MKIRKQYTLDSFCTEIFALIDKYRKTLNKEIEFGEDVYLYSPEEENYKFKYHLQLFKGRK